MILKSLVELLCRPFISDEDLERIAEAGDEEGYRAVAAKLSGFNAGASRAVADASTALLSYDGEPDLLELKPSPQDFEGWDRPALMKECRKRELEYDRHDTKEALIERLCA